MVLQTLRVKLKSARTQLRNAPALTWDMSSTSRLPVGASDIQALAHTSYSSMRVRWFIYPLILMTSSVNVHDRSVFSTKTTVLPEPRF